MISRRDLFAAPTALAAHSGGWGPLLELSTTPGAAVARIERGKLAWAEYLGVRRAGEPGAVTERTLFAAASLTKPVTAFAALSLKDEGKLDLDRPLNDYAAFTDKDRPRRVTARHVLSHSTGFPNWRFKEGEALECSFEPGSRFGYSGEGFYLLQTVMEKLAGQPFPELVNARVLTPSGMSGTTLVEPPSSAELASGHTRRGELRVGGAPPSSALPVSKSPNAAASLWATLPGYARFLLKAFDRADWFEPHTRINTALSWGLGWGLERHNGGLWCWHWGDNPGFKNIVLCNPAKRSGLLIFTNGDNGRALYERIARDVLGDGHAAFLWI
jgi:CubicO group peptidase (beta-lactamase class C family)